MSVTRTLFTIIVILTGLILGSIATINTSIVPTRVQVSTNAEVKVLIKEGTKKVSSINLTGASLLPIHVEDGKFYYSATLNMNDLIIDNKAIENTVQTGYDLYIDTDIENVKLQAELVVEGNDAINHAVRVLLKQNGTYYTLSPENPTVLVDCYLKKSQATSVQLFLYYELADESVNIDNINNAEGCNIKINFYGYIEEE